MAWKRFPYPDRAFEYTAATLKHAWHSLHTGDAEPWPSSGALVDAWIDFHAGRFEQAARAGLDAGMAGYPVANKSSCVHAVYLDPSASSKCARLQQVAERCTQQQVQQPDSAAAFYWHAYALGRYAQEISVVKALAQGIGGKVRASLERTLALAPRHADAHVALGVYHAEVIDKVGALLGGLTYGASRDDALEHFRTALRLNPGSGITRVEYARAMVMLDGTRESAAALSLCRQAATLAPHDAMERLDVERARQELAG